MIILELSAIWNTLFLIPIFYLISLLSFLLLYTPILAHRQSEMSNNANRRWWLITSSEIAPLFVLFALLFANQIVLWTNVTVVTWFGHIYFGNFQWNILALMLGMACLFFSILLPSLLLTNQENFDFLFIAIHFVLWEMLLFFANTILVVVILIEVLSSLILLLFVSSSFSSFYFFSNLDFSSHSYFHQSQPNAFIQSILFVFWISLLVSLNFFLFLIFFYFRFVTSDWFLLEMIFVWLSNSSSLGDMGGIAVVWLGLLISLFFNCGLVPFYFWNPIFFRNSPLIFLFFYITVFYLFLVLFLVSFLIAFVGEIFFFFHLCNVLLSVAGIFLLLLLLFEAFYINVFLAFSSIINTLFILIASFCMHEYVCL